MFGCDLTFGSSQSTSGNPHRHRFPQFPVATRFDTVWAGCTRWDMTPQSCRWPSRLLKYTRVENGLTPTTRLPSQVFRIVQVQCEFNVLLRVLRPIPGLISAFTSRWTDLCQRSQAYEVVCGHVQHEHRIHLLQPAYHRLAHTPHGLHPSKALFDQLALLLGNGVART